MSLTSILIWAVIILALFGYLWWRGQVRRMVVYCQQTWEELKKCSWPSWEELKGSTAVIVISIILLGGFTVVVDVVLNLFFHRIVY
ncbi:MAG TPA: preprotein translocase subunit SecE [Verrucomicrobiae bacterium]|jgi:preprotein translocase subunit SecE|nr:preprotein translocase subunit SecE [Verrucomicrobiae bacterium]